MNKVKQFSVRGAKILAGGVARFATGWLVAKLVSWEILSSTWAADPQHLMMVALIIAGVIYELEEQAWQKWGWDIPGVLARIGVPLMQVTTTEVSAPLAVPSNQPSSVVEEPVTPAPSVAPVDPPKVP